MAEADVKAREARDRVAEWAAYLVGKGYSDVRVGYEQHTYTIITSYRVVEEHHAGCWPPREIRADTTADVGLCLRKTRDPESRVTSLCGLPREHAGRCHA